MTTRSSIQPDLLPATIRGNRAAHVAGAASAAFRPFIPTAVIVDDGTTYRGTEEIRRFPFEARAEIGSTTQLVGAQRVGDAHWVAALTAGRPHEAAGGPTPTSSC
jgi:hypothetical protein